MKALQNNDGHQIYVALGSERSYYRFHELTTSMKSEELLKPDGLVYFPAADLKSASQLCRTFISELGLGASNWIGGRIIDEKGDFVARISYNGKVWDNENWQIAKEIELC